MANYKFQYVCGCGFKCTDARIAGMHSDAAHHQVSMLGTVTPDTPKQKKSRKGTRE